MTGEDIETELRAQSVGWHPVNKGLIHEDIQTPACNAVSCESYARLGNDAGATAVGTATALRALVDGDRGPLDVLIQAAADARAG